MLRRSGIRRIDTVHWDSSGAARAVRSAIRSSSALLVKGVLDSVACARVARAVSEDRPARFLEPFPGENIISYARNKWTEESRRPAVLLKDDAFGQTRIDLKPSFEPSRVPMRRLLGGFRLNARASMIFVTSGGMRTPLHSDERHGVLLHIHGAKNFVVIPAHDSDADAGTLRELLTLRDTSGCHAELYGEPPCNDSLRKVRRLQGELDPGDALFIPQRWLHDIESATPTISVSLRFGAWDSPNG